MTINPTIKRGPCGACFHGILIMNETEIQACDDCKIHATDKAAAEALVNHLQGLGALPYIDDCPYDEIPLNCTFGDLHQHAAAFYAKHGICGYCQSNDMSYSEYELDDHGGWQHVDCNDCGCVTSIGYVRADVCVDYHRDHNADSYSNYAKNQAQTKP